MIAAWIAQLLPSGNLQRRFAEVGRVSALPIAEAGVNSDGIPFVRLEAGPVFFGFPPARVHRLVFRLLTPRDFKRRVPIEAYKVAWDILHRYWEGGHCNQQAQYTLQPGDKVIEAGAFIGYYTLRMARDVGPEGRVISIEPLAENRAIIARNVRLNSLENVQILPYAVSDQSGSATFYTTELQKNSLLPEVLRGRGRTTKVPVEIRTIDEIVRETKLGPPALVILTLNGSELEALYGMEETLAGAGVNLVVAAKYHASGKPILDDVVRFLEDRGFECILDRTGFVKNEDPGAQAVVYASRR